LKPVLPFPRRPRGLEASMSFMKKLLSDESGQGLVEYALILALISVGLIASLTMFKNGIAEVFRDVGITLNSKS
jgi:pilus assembly protein Flp/PilA